MKKIIFGLLLAIGISTSAFANDDFCRGFEQGYATGYKQASGSGLDPLTPLCPLQPLKKLNDPDSDFEHGYLIGLQQGMQKETR